MSQHKDILNYLKAGNSITPIEALNLFGCFRLSAVIFDLKAPNGGAYDIRTTPIQKGKKRFAQYKLHPKKEVQPIMGFGERRFL